MRMMHGAEFAPPLQRTTRLGPGIPRWFERGTPAPGWSGITTGCKDFSICELSARSQSLRTPCPFILGIPMLCPPGLPDDAATGMLLRSFCVQYVADEPMPPYSREQAELCGKPSYSDSRGIRGLAIWNCILTTARRTRRAFHGMVPAYAPKLSGTSWIRSPICISRGCIPRRLRNRPPRIYHSLPHIYRPAPPVPQDGWESTNMRRRRRLLPTIVPNPCQTAHFAVPFPAFGISLSESWRGVCAADNASSCLPASIPAGETFDIVYA
ncbi:hypothetical protein VTO73DRAFT_2197 [Trametes versicolor]